jgi:hypothetical protein
MGSSLTLQLNSKRLDPHDVRLRRKGLERTRQNPEQLYQALRRRGITTSLVVYPGEHHGGWTTLHQKDFLDRWLAWYDQYVKGENPNAAD